MNLLLDTSIFLWYISANPKLSEHHKELIQDSNNTVYLSVVSVWEALIKQQLGKLTLSEPAFEYLVELRQQHKVISLALDEQSIRELPLLPSIHRDPFDRMLICQARERGITIVTTDKLIPLYPVNTI